MDLIAQIVRAFGMDPKVGGRDVFCLKNFDTFTRTLHITFQLICTLHIEPCSSSPDIDANAV